MFPDLSYIFHALFGTEPDNAWSLVKTFGLLLGIAIAASGWILSFELVRKEKLGQIKGRLENLVVYKPIDWNEVVLQTLFNFLLAFKIGLLYSSYKNFQRDPSEAIFSLQGNWTWGIIAGLITAIYWIYRMQTQERNVLQIEEVLVRPSDRLVTITILAGAYGILGSKLFSVLENFGDFMKDPIGTFFSGSGLTIYGGLILAFIMVTRYMISKGLHPLHMMDAIAPTLMIGYGVGRLGCHFSGDGDWGIVNESVKPSWFILPDSFWSFNYAHNVAEEGVKIESCVWNYCNQLQPPVYPTPLYEFFFAFIIFGILWSLRKRIPYAGVLFFIYCFLNGVERFFIEIIRVNPRYDVWGFHPSLSQGIAFLLILVGIGGASYFWKKKII
ncbi:MAG: prolipoprotein diacylglyceryl transferase family protein [Saprospiraceae bacterium]